MVEVEVEHLVDVSPESMNFCPVCDDPVQLHQEAVVATGWGLKTLAHKHCTDET